MRKTIFIWLRNFFGFSRTEANGFIILSLLMLLILLAPIISKNYLLQHQINMQTEADRKELTALLRKLENNSTIKKDKTPKESAPLQNFDLNLSNTKDLEKAGFPSFLAKRIVKYRKNIKPFAQKSDLLKIYGVDSSLYKKVYPRMDITKVPQRKKPKPQKAENTKTTNKPKESKKTRLSAVDINNADSSQLQNIYGIGPAYSKRIIKYREFLGGYHSLQQLDEVYGLKQENLDSLKKYVFLKDKLKLRQLKVNQLEADSLVDHPYISYKEANLLVNYRKQHGEFKSVSDLLAIKILDSSWVKKVTPYISFD
ncbi:MAG: helix-hairpin-helix domain-containing protein [Bacteroidota bacterium]